MKKIFYTAMILALMIPNFCGASPIQSWKMDGEYHVNCPSLDVDISPKDLEIYAPIIVKINEAVHDFWDSLKYDSFVKSTLDYEITCDDKNILSIILTATNLVDGGIYDKDANGNDIPFIYKRTLNFDTRTGDFIERDDLPKYFPNVKPQDISKKLMAYAKKNNFELSDNLKNLELIPDVFYVDKNSHLHFIFPKYELSLAFKYYEFVDIEGD